MTHDQAFKELLQTYFWEFLQAFLPNVAAYLDPTYFEFLDKEIFTDLPGGERHEVDLLVKVRFRAASPVAPGQEAFFLIHVENQAKPQTDFARRMFLYFARLTAKYNLPVYPVAILSYDTPLRAEPDTYAVTFPDLDVLHFRYQAIQLNRLSWRDFVQTPNPVAAALMAKMNVPQEDRVQVQLEVLRVIRTLKIDPAKSKLIGGFLDAYLRLTGEEMKQYERAVARLPQEEREETMEIISRWELKGREEGREEGRQEGRQEGMHNGKEEIVARQVQKRFGPLNQTVQQRLNQLTEEQLNEFGVALFDFSSLEDMEAWLSRN